MNDPIANMLAEASVSAAAGTIKANANKVQGTQIRASRIGLPLLQLVLEDLVLPDERMESVLKNDIDPKPRVQLPTAMRIATGHLFEAAYHQELIARYGAANVLHNGELNCKTPQEINISGTYDFLVLEPNVNKVTIHECKALNVYGIKDAEDKLLTDNWGYLTQLALYTYAVQQMFPNAEVNAQWVVWCKKLEKMLVVPFPIELVNELVYLAGENAKAYQGVLEFIDRRCFTLASTLTIDMTVELPLKKQSKAGYWYNTCGLHYRAESSLFTEADGSMKPDNECVRALEKLMQNNLTSEIILG